MKRLSLNHRWRIIAAGLSYIIFGIGASLPGVYIFLLAIVPMDKATKQRKARNAIQLLCRFYVNVMRFLGCFSYQVHGEPPKQLSGHLVIANHSMLIDALFVMAYVENVCCVVKASLWHNPFTCIPARLAGFIANNDQQLVDIATRRLENGENVLIFPEGTRNQHDLQLDFKRGAANIGIIGDAPILPIILCATPRVLTKGLKWYQMPTAKPKITMQFRPIIRVDDCIDTEQPRTLQYRALTQWLRAYYVKAVSAVVGS